MDVKITSDGTPCGTKVVSLDGRELQGITSIKWGVAVDEPAVAKIEIGMVEIECSGEAAFFVQPIDNGVRKCRRVKAIEFEDGERMDLMDG